MSVTLSALCALLQLMVLPGLIMQRLIFPDRSTLTLENRLPLVFCGSALFSFLLLLVLHQVGLHQRWVWVCVGVVECIALLLLARRREHSSVIEVAQRQWPQQWLHRMLAVVYAIGLVILIVTVGSHWPGVLEGWDSIISWNRWALDWARGDWPFLTWDYPQLIPALWSILYLWQGSSEIEIFVRAWLGCFPVLLILAMWARSKNASTWAPLLAGLFLVWVLIKSYLYVLDTGYVDLPVTCFVLLTAHWVLLAGEDPARGKQWLYCAAVAAAAATLVKVSGLLAVAVWVYGLRVYRGDHREKLGLLAALILMIAPYYGLHWLNGTHETVATYTTGDIYGAETLPQRLQRALTVTLPALLFPGTGIAVHIIAAIVAVFVLLTTMSTVQGRFYASFGLVYLLAWAALLSYDGRNLLPGLPFLLLAIFTGLERGVARWSNPLGDAATPVQHTPIAESIPAYRQLWPALVLLVFLIGFLPVRDRLAWEDHTNTLRKQSGDPQLNKQLIDFVNSPEFSGLIYTTYPLLASIPELRSALFVDYGTSHMQPETAAALNANAPLCSILATFPRFETINYLLLHDSVYPLVIENALADSSLRQVMSWPGLRLLEVDCLNTAAGN